jgi:hypothetical protein
MNECDVIRFETSVAIFRRGEISADPILHEPCLLRPPPPHHFGPT